MTVSTGAPRARFRPPPLPSVAMGGFWGRWIDTVRDVTAPLLRRRCEEAGMFEQIDPDRPVPALRIPIQASGTVTAQMFWDSDLGKVIETAAYCLAHRRDAALETQIDAVVETFGRLQQPDGYLNSWYIRMQPGQRWTNMRDCHELYCAGHLLEGAVAYWQATGKRRLLDILCGYLEHIGQVIGTGPGQLPGYPGHQEIELALIKLYRATDERKYLDLSRYFIDQRGQEPKYFEQEALRRGEEPGRWHHGTAEYNQWHLPVREQDKVVGHAVRAMYMYSGMADVAAETGDPSLQAALDRLWADLVGKRLYVTGGMGPSAQNEGFTEDYDLPNQSAYAETCAAVGLVFWAQRMLGLSLQGRYGDMMERALYNGALAGISLDGASFFYENPLESRGDHHRWQWHRCPCCPPNLARLIASVGTYACAEGDREIAVHLYGESQASLDIGDGAKLQLTQHSRYPWDGRIDIAVDPQRVTHFALHLRIPAWCANPRLMLNGAAIDVAASVTDGYVRVEREWRPGDKMTLDLPMPVQRLHAHPNVRADAGRIALQRGPLIYCLESADHTTPLNRIVLPEQSAVDEQVQPDLLGGVVTLHAKAQAEQVAEWGQEIYRSQAAELAAVALTAVPYFAWDNRASGEMLVWIRQQPAA